MNERLYREVRGLAEDAPLAEVCSECGASLDAQTRHLVVVVHEYAGGGEDGAYALCGGCAALMLRGVWGRP